MELIEQLISNLGVGEDQAKGGAGLLFQMAQSKLGGSEFSQIASVVPGMNDLLQAAPSVGGGGGGLLSKALSMFGKGGGSLGSLASLAGGFSQLGMDGSMATQFIPVVLSFVQQQGGDQMKGLLERVLR